MDSRAVLVFGFVQVRLFVLREVTAVLGFVDAFTARDVGIVALVPGSLLAIDLAVGNASVDAVLLIGQSLINLVDAWVARDIGTGRLGERSTRK